MKRLAIGCAIALGLVAAGSSAAYAGEYTGNGDPTSGPAHASSECAYSGLDKADALENNPPGFDDDAIAVRGNQSPGGVDRYHGVQSYGSFVKAGLKAYVPSPGMACRGNAPGE
ncbi:hypothetical protein [Microbacterium sp. 22242]|uniref:hypothetical protein n=1 Tax=Microbacterium sp. 22242 TaxID=3453896 RepID=UPI003F8645E7